MDQIVRRKRNRRGEVNRADRRFFKAIMAGPVIRVRSRIFYSPSTKQTFHPNIVERNVPAFQLERHYFPVPGKLALEVLAMRGTEFPATTVQFLARERGLYKPPNLRVDPLPRHIHVRVKAELARRCGEYDDLEKVVEQYLLHFEEQQKCRLDISRISSSSSWSVQVATPSGTWASLWGPVACSWEWPA